MPPTDDGELRALQQKAYGRDGGLTDAEAARLRELEDARDAPTAVDEQPDAVFAIAAPERASAAPERASADPDRDAVAEHGAPSGPAAVSDGAAGSPGGARRALRLYWRIVATASALLFLAGFGAGWMLFGPAVLPIAVPAGQQAALVMIEEGAYDPGSIRFVGEKHGVGIWTATRDEGASECIVMTHEEKQASECRAIGEEPDGFAFIGLTAGLEFEEDGESVMVWATMLPDITGEQTTVVQRSVMTQGDWRMEYTEAEVDAAERLEQEGFEPYGLQLVGYDDDLPIWQGWRAQESCLMAVVASEAHVACRDVNAGGDTVSLRLGTTDYELRETQTRGPLFSITRNAPADGKTDPLELGGEHGDPIEVTPDSPTG